MLNNFNTISEAISFSREMLLTYGETVTTESWQGIKNQVKMREFLNCYWSANIPQDLKTLREQIKPDLPWADKHFEERVGGQPLNPGETYKIWPYYKNVQFNDKNFRTVATYKTSNGSTGEISEEKFTHTYMERYWPVHAGDNPNATNGGVRYKYGDLHDIVNLLAKEPYTRQAYLPVWFPEDTGVLHGGRVPCSIGYHFIMRHNKLNVHYTIRACDMVRHFRNDIYLTCRLLHWVLNELIAYSDVWKDVNQGLLTMDIISLHCFDQERNLI